MNDEQTARAKAEAGETPAPPRTPATPRTPAPPEIGQEAGETPAPPETPATPETPAPPRTPATPRTSRTLSVSDVARRRGIEPRTVRRWCDPRGAYHGRLCPHDRVPARVGGNDAGEVIRLNLEEVAAWCEAQGVGRARSLEDRERNQSGPVEYTVDGEVVGPKRVAGGSRDQATSEDAPSASNPAVPHSSIPSGAIAPGDERAAVRAQIESLGGIVHELQVALAEFKRTGKADGLSTAQLQQAVTAAQKVSQEVRQLDAQDLARQRERGELVARGVAERVVRSAIEAIVTMNESLRQDVCDELVRRGVVIDGVGEEAAARKIYALLEPLFDQARNRAAEELGAAGEIGGGMQEAA